MSGDLAQGDGTPAPTLILSGAEIASLMSPADWQEAVEAAFRAVAEERSRSPAPMAIEGEGGTFHAKGAALRLGRVWAGVKVNGNFPSNNGIGLPTIQGAILLFDGRTGAVRAILDSIEVTLRRTAAATALAARHLARPDSRTIAICGCGAQGLAHLEALRGLLRLDRLLAWDRDPARARRLADQARESGLRAEAIGDLAEVRGSDVVVTCTTARTPFLSADLVAPGTFVAAVGTDSPDKSEIEPGLMAAARIVVDSLDQCAAMGDLRHALAAGAVALEDVHGELADLVAGRRPSRTSDAQITLFDSTGMAVQDVACAASILERAEASGEGRRVALG